MQTVSSSQGFLDLCNASFGKSPTGEVGEFNACGQELDIQNKARKIRDLGSSPSNKVGLEIQLYDNPLADEQLASSGTRMVSPTQFSMCNQAETCSTCTL